MTTTVICLKAGNLYSAEYVNNLYCGIKRNTSRPFKFICFTDDSSDIMSEVETRPLPTNRYPLKGWWWKLWFFSPEIQIDGRILYFDLDTVVVGPIDEFFDFQGEFAILRGMFESVRNPQSKAMGSGIMAWRAGWGRQIWDTFRSNIDLGMKAGGDQQFIMKVVKPEQVTYWQDFLQRHKLCSYKAHVRDKPQRDQVPDGVSVICFHGKPRPVEVRHLPWMKQHWNVEVPVPKVEEGTGEDVREAVEVQFPLEQSPDSKYPIQWIPIEALIHKRTTKDLVPSSIQLEENAKAQDWYSWVETQLLNMEMENFDPSEPHPGHPHGPLADVFYRDSIFRTYCHIRDTKAVWNPILAVLERDGNYYIVKGSQRVCALRALKYQGDVPCRVLHWQEDLSTDHNPAIQNHPYREVPGYEELRKPVVEIRPSVPIKGVLVVKTGPNKTLNIASNRPTILQPHVYELVKDQIDHSKYRVTMKDLYREGCF